MQANPKQITILVIAVLFLIVLLQNTQVVTFSLLFWEVRMSQIILLPLMLALGFIGGYLTHSIRQRRKQGNTSGKGGHHPQTVRQETKRDFHAPVD